MQFGEKMKKSLLRALAPAAILACAAVSQSAHLYNVYGVTTENSLIKFKSGSPGEIESAMFIQGLASNEEVIGMDFRPADGSLVALGSFGNLYSLNTMNGMATYMSTLTEALNGTKFGVNFNPTVDRLRVISELDQNLRVNVDTGATIVDGTLNGTPDPYIVNGAYTNNDSDPNTGTMLYTIDSETDMLNLQNPANSGDQVQVGSLGLDVSGLVGFDILFEDGVNYAFASFQGVGNEGSSFYRIDLANGNTSLLGSITFNQSSDVVAVRDIALEPVPEPATMAIFGLGAAALAARRRKKGKA